MSCPQPGFRGDFSWNQSPRSELASRRKKGMFFRESIADRLSPLTEGGAFLFWPRGNRIPASLLHLNSRCFPQPCLASRFTARAAAPGVADCGGIGIARAAGKANHGQKNGQRREGGQQGGAARMEGRTAGYFGFVSAVGQSVRCHGSHSLKTASVAIYWTGG